MLYVRFEKFSNSDKCFKIYQVQLKIHKSMKFEMLFKTHLFITFYVGACTETHGLDGRSQPQKNFC